MPRVLSPSSETVKGLGSNMTYTLISKACGMNIVLIVFMVAFKKVFERLCSRLSQDNPALTKSLLLGLHERFYHCPIGDFKNLLLRAGVPAEVIPLAVEAVMSCAICRKYVRQPLFPKP